VQGKGGSPLLRPSRTSKRDRGSEAAATASIIPARDSEDRPFHWAKRKQAYSPRFSAEDPTKTLRPSANVTFFAFAKLDWSLAR
jgi:hypothetical protein